MDAEWCSMSALSFISGDADRRCSITYRRYSTPSHDRIFTNPIQRLDASGSFVAI